MTNKRYINVIGAGLAGCEAALQIASRSIDVKLFDMKPKKMSPAHHSTLPAELVCSNSLKAISEENASGILKKEMEMLGSAVIKSAYANRVPAGGALAVDREGFSGHINSLIKDNPRIELICAEISEIPENETTVIATGPLTSHDLADAIIRLSGKESMYFYDAAAPIVNAATIDFDRAFRASRYGKGGDDYINCPMNREEYLEFYNFLVKAERVELKGFEKSKVFEGCMPVEIMASRGFDTLRYGPMKPVGLTDPRTGELPYAVVQLRAENEDRTMYNLVGFQTNLKFGEQQKLMKLIPGLGDAEIERYGVMHRNTYLRSPGFLDSHLQTVEFNGLFFAGQLTGVEGYLESAVTGIAAGIFASRFPKGVPLFDFPKETITGSLLSYVSGYSGSDFQPMNANFGILPPLEKIERNKKARKQKMAERAITAMKTTAGKIMTAF